MRPIRLVIEGVNSFIDAQELDFEAVGRSNLFCICGKTGAGKTTVFDSIMLALYGRCGRGNLGEIVNLTRKTARVVFEFSEGGDTYCVERVIAKKSDKDGASELAAQGNTKELTLSKNGEPIGSGGTAAELIAGIVGLDESEFKTVYLLEQGKYSDFLKLSPTDQSRAVGKIFSLMRFGEVAKRAGVREREEQLRLEGLDKEIEAVADATPDAVKDAQKNLASLRAKNAALKKDIDTQKTELNALEKSRDAYLSAEKMAKEVKRQEERLAEAKSALADAQKKLDEFAAADDGGAEKAKKLDALRGELNRLSELSALDREYGAAADDAQKKRAASESAATSAAAAATERGETDAAAERDYSRFCAALDRFGAVADKLNDKSQAVAAAVSALCDETDRDKRLSAVDAAIYKIQDELKNFDALCLSRDKLRDKRDISKKAADALLEKIARYGEELAKIAEQKAAAESEVKAAETALSAARTGSHAAAVRGELHDGDTCPVCGGVYRASGACDGDTDVEKRKSELDGAREKLKAAEKRELDGNKYIDIAKADHEREGKAVREADDEISETECKIKETRVDKAAYAQMLDALKSAQMFGNDYKKSATARAERAANEVKLTETARAAKAAADEAAKRAEQYMSRLGDMCGKTEGAIATVRESISGLESEIKSREDEQKRLSAARDGAKAAVETLERSLAAARAECPVDMPEFDEDDYRQKRALESEHERTYAERDKEIALKDAELKLFAEKSETLVKKQNERAATVKRADIFADIKKLTHGNAMLNYVAAEYIEEFTETASEILGTMSGGKYSMAYDSDGGFVVTDYLNGGKSRRTDTLSGGEMFLASLAVAIAIARAQSKGNNAFFFLDEGFGTLDEDLIDTVYSALETLSKDCLVGVISHSGALIGLMPACVTVDEATDSAGSKIRF